MWDQEIRDLRLLTIDILTNPKTKHNLLLFNFLKLTKYWVCGYVLTYAELEHHVRMIKWVWVGFESCLARFKSKNLFTFNGPRPKSELDLHGLKILDMDSDPIIW